MDTSTTVTGGGAELASGASTPRRRWIWRELLAAALTLSLLGWLLSRLDWARVRPFVTHIDPVLVGAAFLVYAASYVARALRWQLLLQRRDLTFADLYLITSAHIMFNNLLPSRIGELSYVVLLKQQRGVTTADGVVSLLVSRFLDFITLGLIFLLSVASFRGTHAVQAFKNLPLVAVSSVVVLSIGLAALPRLTVACHAWLRRDLGRLVPGSLRARIERGAERVVETFERTAGTAVYLKAGLLSLVIWYAKFLAFTFMVHAMHDAGTVSRMSFFTVVIGSTAAELTTITPFHGVAGIGTYETAWAWVFHNVLGIDQNLAILTGFGVHILTLFFSIVLGGLAYLALRLRVRAAGE